MAVSKKAPAKAPQNAPSASKPGRVSAWSDEEQAEIVERVLVGMAEGKTLTDTVNAVGATLDRPVTPGTVRRWMIANEAWFGRYQRTKVLLGQALAEEAIQVARDSTSHSSNIDRVLIETLKWAASKANPTEYGERQTVEHQGAQTLQIKVIESEGTPAQGYLPPETPVAVLAQASHTPLLAPGKA